MKQLLAIKPLLIAMAAMLLTSCEGSMSTEEDRLVEFAQQFDDKELELLARIRFAKTSDDRERWLAALEATPEKSRPFYSRWEFLHEIKPYHCWIDDGYKPSLSDVPRDIQLLAATSYGLADIRNGGFHQFFGNSTGAFAPEMTEWFERADMPDAAKIMKQAIAIFGDSFPRSQRGRRVILQNYARERHAEVGSETWGSSREDWDPFHELNNPFYEATDGPDASYDKPDTFDIQANKWLREVCGITDLRTEYEAE